MAHVAAEGIRKEVDEIDLPEGGQHGPPFEGGKRLRIGREGHGRADEESERIAALGL
jgi:hypothetical protein